MGLELKIEPWNIQPTA